MFENHEIHPKQIAGGQALNAEKILGELTSMIFPSLLVMTCMK